MTAEALCNRCNERPRSSAQRWCRQCHTEYVRERRGPSKAGILSGVYFIQCGDFVKIGFATNVESRYRQIHSHNPHKTTPLGYIRVPTIGDAMALESLLHDVFKADKHRGEWFRVSQKLSDYIASEAIEWPGSMWTREKQAS